MPRHAPNMTAPLSYNGQVLATSPDLGIAGQPRHQDGSLTVSPFTVGYERGYGGQSGGSWG